MALPIGWAADNFGRKPVLIVGNISFVLKAVWIQVICESKNSLVSIESPG